MLSKYMASIAGKRWFSFSIKTMLLIMAALSVGLGIYFKSFRDRRAAIAAVEDLNGWISYKESGPNWLRKFVSDEKCFWNPTAVRFDPKHPVTDDELQSVISHLMKFDDLTYLNFDRSQITDTGLAQLLPLANKLESLDIRGTRVSDNGIANLQRLPKLTLLRLKDSAISTDGMETIHKTLPSCKLE
jgi:hypothetical protein